MESKKAYNVTVTPLARVAKSTTKAGKSMLKFRASMTVRGRDIERTVIAQGSAAALLNGMVKKGSAIAVRALFERAPANDDGTQGGEYLAVVALPRAKAA